MYFLIILLISMIAMRLVMPAVIIKLKKIKFGQSVRTDGPQSHLAKEGTPTMGGLAFVAISLIVGLLFSQTIENIILAISLGLFALIGFIDDYLIVVRKDTKGLSSKHKLAFQLLFATVIFLVARIFLENFDTSIKLYPFDIFIELGVFYYFVFIFIYLALSNAVNLTDGLDGLSSSVTITVLFGFIGVLILGGYTVSDLSVIVALLGSLFVFLLYNKKPAKIFMGDTGSLALGGLVAGFAVVFRVELIVLLFSVIYLAETLSVMIQVFYFKKTAKRIFKMAPLHHHYELCGLSEVAIVKRFVIVNSVFVIFGLLLYFMSI